MILPNKTKGILTVKCTLATLCLCLGLYSNASFATQKEAVSDAERTQIVHALEKLTKVTGKKFKLTDLKPSPIAGLFQVTSDMNVFYVSKDGRYLLSGEMLDLSKDKNSWGLTEQAQREIRKKTLLGLNIKDMIVYAAKAPQIGAVYIFTDIDCHYCEHLQAHIKDYTDLGIEIRYLAFPRSGPKSPSFDKAISVWCSKDRQRDYTLATQGKEIPKNHCSNNPVAKDFELGVRMGVNGTPTIILENGVKIGGLADAKELAKLIKEEIK